MDRNGKFLVTGGNGFLGRTVISKLMTEGVTAENIISPSSVTCDLRDKSNARAILSDVDYCIHLAARVGGIGFNQQYPATLFYDNIIMGTNIIEAAYTANIKKLLVVGTVCAYPKFTPVPFREEDLWNGYPEETNAPYGIAKKALLVYLNACRQQFGLNGIFLLPVNLYGPGDNFSTESSHVIPALIRKIYEAQMNGVERVTIWGTGSASREFLYVEDCADGIVKAFKHYNGSDPINLGASFEITIKDLVQTLVDIMHFRGIIEWDTSKPDGQPRRKLDVSKAEKLFGFKAQTSLYVGLTKTVDWYRQFRSR